MKKTAIIFFFIAIGYMIPVYAFGKSVKYPIIEIVTSHGNLYVWLYDDTPLHKQNFIKLTREGFYDQTRFHRIIKDFMIQGGDPTSKYDSLKGKWGQGGPGYTLNAEISGTRFHKKGVLAAARMGDQVNPQRASSGSQFYIVEGTTFNDQSLDIIEKQIAMAIHNPEFKFTQEMRSAYKEVGGAPHLDMQYTVFGEVIYGIEVVDRISVVKTGSQDKPLENVEMDVNVLELTSKQIKKKFGFIVPGSEKKR